MRRKLRKWDRDRGKWDRDRESEIESKKVRLRQWARDREIEIETEKEETEKLRK